MNGIEAGLIKCLFCGFRTFTITKCPDCLLNLCEKCIRPSDHKCIGKPILIQAVKENFKICQICNKQIGLTEIYECKECGAITCLKDKYHDLHTKIIEKIEPVINMPIFMEKGMKINNDKILFEMPFPPIEKDFSEETNKNMQEIIDLQKLRTDIKLGQKSKHLIIKRIDIAFDKNDKNIENMQENKPQEISVFDIQPPICTSSIDGEIQSTVDIDNIPEEVKIMKPEKIPELEKPIINFDTALQSLRNIKEKSDTPLPMKKEESLKIIYSISSYSKN